MIQKNSTSDFVGEAKTNLREKNMEQCCSLYASRFTKNMCTTSKILHITLYIFLHFLQSTKIGEMEY